MTWLPYTTARLVEAGESPLPLEFAAECCFNALAVEDGEIVRKAMYSSDNTTQRFWDAFAAARKALRKEAA